MKRIIAWMLCFCSLIGLLGTAAFAALPTGTGTVTSCKNVSGSEFSANATIAAKLDKMFAGNIGLYVDKNKTKPVNAALGTRNVPNNGKYQYWGSGHAGTSCFAYANAFYGTFYDGVSPHHTLNANHQKVKATGKITYNNFVKWGVRDDAIVYIREGNHSFIVLHYDKEYLTIVDGNGDGKGLIAIRKQPWKYCSGSNIFNQKPSLIVQPKTSYFAAGKMKQKAPTPCTEGGSYHTWDDGVITVQPSCNAAGTKVYTCSGCGKTNSETISKTSKHTYGDWTVTKAATCESAGSKVRVCSICGKKNTKKISGGEHTFSESRVVRQATIFSAGLTEQSCQSCGETTQQESPCSVTDRKTGVSLETQLGVFQEDTLIKIFRVTETDGGVYDCVTEAMEGVSGSFAAYAVLAIAKNTAVQPNGSVKLSVKIPEDFGQNLALYFAYEDGTSQPLESTLSEDGTTLFAEITRMGYCILCDLDVPPLPIETEATELTEETETEPATEADAVPKEMPERWIVLAASAAAGVTLAAVGTVLIVKRKKAKKKEPAQEPEQQPEEIHTVQ